MEKLVYLVWERPSTPAEEWGERVRGQLVPALTSLEPRALWLTVDDDGADASPPVPVPDDELPVRLAVSIWLDNHDLRGTYEDALRSFGVRRAGYLVTESLVEDYGTTPARTAPRDWPDGDRSPGITVLTTFCKRGGLDERTFFEHWYGHQTPMSAGMQPRVRYVRNAVVRGVTPGAPPLDAIVEESWPTVEHLTDPNTFFGTDDSSELGENIRVMLDSMKVFADSTSLRTYTMSEYLLRG